MTLGWQGRVCVSLKVCVFQLSKCGLSRVHNETRSIFFFLAAKWDTPQTSYYGLVNTEVSEPLMLTDCVLCVHICRHAAVPLLIKGCGFF